MTSSESSYKLTYFTLRGLGESIRLIFAYADVEYEDKRIAQDDWPALKESYKFGKLPTLEVDGQIIDQSVAICRFLGKRFELVEADPVKEAQLEAIVANIEDLLNKIRAAMNYKTEEAKKESDDFLKKIYTAYEEVVVDGHFYGTKTTNWVEIYFTGINEWLESRGGPDFMKPYPRLSSVIQNVKSNDGVKKWIEKRPADVFNLRQ